VGWASDRRGSVVNANAAVLHLKKGSHNIICHRINTGLGDGTSVTIQSMGGPLAVVKAEPAANNPIPAPAAPTPVLKAEIKAEIKGGLPVPSDYTSYSADATDFRKTYTLETATAVADLAGFYRRELPKLGWEEKPTPASRDRTTLRFDGRAGILSVVIQRADSGSRVEVVSKVADAARKAGILPAAGRTWLIVGNTARAAVNLSVDNRMIQIGAGVGAQKPDGPKFELSPGRHRYRLVFAGKDPIDGTIDVGPDETWGL
jgi:hypothetical protein